MTAWIALIAASLLTLALRAGPSLVKGSAALPTALKRANRFAAPALMGALASRGVVAQASVGALPAVVMVAAAVPTAFRTRSMALTIAVGTAAHFAAAVAFG
jgi:branched-subunit amino acid transport protein